MSIDLLTEQKFLFSQIFFRWKILRSFEFSNRTLKSTQNPNLFNKKPKPKKMPSKRRVRPTTSYDDEEPTNGELVGLPQVFPDGSTAYTPLPKIVLQPARSKEFDAIVSLGARRQRSTNPFAKPAAAPAVQVQALEEETLADADEADDVQEEDIVVAAPKVKRAKKESDTKSQEAHEGFNGLKGWKYIGTCPEVIAMVNSGAVQEGSWLQYTRTRSTFIPAATYKKLRLEAEHTKVPLEDLVQREKDKETAKGRKKTLCAVKKSEDQTLQATTICLSSIPPKGDRGSSFYPQQIRSWTLQDTTDGDVKFYQKEF